MACCNVIIPNNGNIPMYITNGRVFGGTPNILIFWLFLDNLSIYEQTIDRELMMVCVMLSRISLFVTWSLYEMPNKTLYKSHFKQANFPLEVCILLSWLYLSFTSSVSGSVFQKQYFLPNKSIRAWFYLRFCLSNWCSCFKVLFHSNMSQTFLSSLLCMHMLKFPTI